jgi:hypothetical protein
MKLVSLYLLLWMEGVVLYKFSGLSHEGTTRRSDTKATVVERAGCWHFSVYFARSNDACGTTRYSGASALVRQTACQIKRHDVVELLRFGVRDSSTCPDSLLERMAIRWNEFYHASMVTITAWSGKIDAQLIGICHVTSLGWALSTISSISILLDNRCMATGSNADDVVRSALRSVLVAALIPYFLAWQATNRCGTNRCGGQ